MSFSPRSGGFFSQPNRRPLHGVGAALLSTSRRIVIGRRALSPLPYPSHDALRFIARASGNNGGNLMPGFPRLPGFSPELLTGVACIAGLVLLNFNAFTAIVPVGQCGIEDRFGVVSSTVLDPGFHLKSPLSRVVTVDLKTQLLDSVQDVPTAEGLIVHLEVSVLYHVSEPQSAKALYSTVGEEYREVLLMPEVRSTLRNLTSEQNAKALYSNGRSVLSEALLSELNHKLNPRGVTVEQVLLRNITLPAQVTAAIEEKLKAEQESQRMEFVLLKEKQEAERKRIEAQGIADFQNIVTKGISKELLEWKGIEATEKLASSNNSKVVIIGNPANGLPVILGDATHK